MTALPEHPMFNHINLDEIYGVVTPMSRETLDSKVFIIELAKRHPNAPKPKIYVSKVDGNTFVAFDVYLAREEALKKAKGRDFISEPIEMTVEEMLQFAYDQIVSMGLRFRIAGDEEISAIIVEPHMEKYFMFARDKAQVFEDRAEFIRTQERRSANLTRSQRAKIKSVIEGVDSGAEVDIYMINRVDGWSDIVDINPSRELTRAEHAELQKKLRKIQSETGNEFFAFVGNPDAKKALGEQKPNGAQVKVGEIAQPDSPFSLEMPEGVSALRSFRDLGRLTRS